MRLDLILGTAVIAMSLSTLGPSAHATVFTDNEFVTWSQGGWGQDPSPGNAAALLKAQFGTVYPSGILQVGISGTPGLHFIDFDSADALIAYLPAEGAANALTADLLDPMDIILGGPGTFGGEVATLKLNIDFSAAALLAHPAGVPFGSLILTGLTGSFSSLNGLTVSDLLIQENLALAGASSDFSDPEDAFLLANDVDMAFNAGPVSTFADQNLELPTPPTTPLPATLPLFATGLGAVGLLGMRRKRKAQAAI
jgi:hypothetical protein